MAHGLELLLEQLVSERSRFEYAVWAFKLYFRLVNHRVGMPDYPEITWEVIETFLREHSSATILENEEP